MGGWFVDVIAEWTVRLVVKVLGRIHSRDWPVVTATITNARCDRAGYGCHVADIHYDHAFGSEEFSTFHEEPFLLHDLGKDYIQRFPAGRETPVQVNPVDPSKSVLVRG